eukprot:scaffold185741_cov14-Prasinocladus_malaysianus.AAC.1
MSKLIDNRGSNRSKNVLGSAVATCFEMISIGRARSAADHWRERFKALPGKVRLLVSMATGCHRSLRLKAQY